MRSSEGETELVRQTREVLLTDSERNRERESEGEGDREMSSRPLSREMHLFLLHKEMR